MGLPVCARAVALQGGGFRVAVTRWSRSTQLLYVEVGYIVRDGWLPSGR